MVTPKKGSGIERKPRAKATTPEARENQLISLAHDVAEKQMLEGTASAMVITHYQRMLDYLKPDFVHVLVKGRVVKEGTAQLGYDIEEKGFDWIVNSIEEA